MQQYTFETCEGENYTELYVWGKNNQGQLGLGNIQQEPLYIAPKLTTFNLVIKQIACGEDHTAILTNDGLVYTVGSNLTGQLGIGLVNKDLKYCTSPTIVEKLKGIRCIQVSCGWTTTIAVMDNGEAYSWGKGEYGSLGLGSTDNEFAPQKVYLQDKRPFSVRKASSGARHSAFLTDDGQIYCSGANEVGQLGLGEKSKNVYYPKLIAQVPKVHKWVDLSCGTAHSLFLSQEGQVYGTGNNKFGQLGLGDKRSVSMPTKIKDLEREVIIKIKSGHHSGALSNKGNLFIWGTGSFGEYLFPTNFFSGQKNITNFDIGGLFGIACDTQGITYGWGSNQNGELGIGDTEPRSKPFAISSIQGIAIKQIACGTSHVYVLGKDVNYNFVSQQEANFGQGIEQIQQSKSPRSSIFQQSEILSPTTQAKKRGSSVSFYNQQREFVSPSRNNELNRTNDSFQKHSFHSQNIRKTDLGSSKIVDFVSQDPSIDVVLSENKYIETNLNFEKQERRRLEKLNLELRLKIKELQDGRGGVKELDERLQDCIDQIDSIKEKYNISQIKIMEIENDLMAEKNDKQLLQEQLRKITNELEIVNGDNQTLIDRLDEKTKQLETIESQFSKLSEHSKLREKSDFSENEKLQMKVFDLQSQLQREQENKRKSDNIKNNERFEMINLEQEKAEIQNQYVDLERKYAGTLLTLENEVSHKNKIQDALKLSNERIFNLENENTSLIQEIADLRRILYENIEENLGSQTIEVQTLFKVNKQLTEDVTAYKRKYNDAQQDYQSLKAKFNALLSQLQHSEHKNLHLSMFIDNQRTLSQSHLDLQQNQSYHSINNGVNNNNQYQDIGQYQHTGATDRQISDLLESANKHAKNMTRIIKDSNQESTVHRLQNFSPNFRASFGDNINRSQSPSKYHRINTESDQKLREALDLPSFQENPLRKSNKKTPTKFQDSNKKKKDENIQGLGEIQQKLEKLQKDKKKLEQKLSRYDSLKKSQRASLQYSSGKKKSVFN